MDKETKLVDSSEQAPEIIQFDQRLKNVEQIVDVVKHVSDNAVKTLLSIIRQCGIERAEFDAD